MNEGPRHTFRLRWSGYHLDLDQRTHIMGVLNVTPDSFSDGGRFFERDRAIEHGLAMARDGADILDVGGESTRPYAQKVSLDEEIDRVIPVIHALSKETNIPISIDSFKSKVVLEALRAGASIINDVSALRFDPEMISVAANANVPLILMHMKGTPADMQDSPVYEHLIPEITTFLKNAMDRAVKGGVRKEMIMIDPGIGFGKTVDHNLAIIKGLGHFRALENPILLGTSRKAFLGHILGKDAPDRDLGTMATVAAAVMNGAHVIRVHNVKMAKETITVIDAIKNAHTEEPSV